MVTYYLGDLKKQPSLPADVMENINSMQSTVEQLLADMSLVSDMTCLTSSTTFIIHSYPHNYPLVLILD